jgi:hypothetical protein
MHDLLPLAILPNRDLSVTQSEWEMMEGRGRVVGRVEDEHAFEKG